MANRTSKLLSASWRGIPFFIKSEAMTEGGRRIILHEYPNSSQRYVEDLGEMPPKFKLDAYVTGADFLDRADQLERALTQTGKGRLSMPTFGVRTLFAMPYTKDASQQAVGEIKFSLEFAAGKALSGPKQAADTAKTVYNLGDSARDAISEALGDTWQVPSVVSNVQTAIDDLQGYVNEAQSLVTTVTNLTDFEKITGYLLNNAQTIVRSATTLPESFIGGLWQTVSEGLDLGAGIENLLGLCSYGNDLSLSLSDTTSAISTDSDSIPLWPVTTASRIQRNTNRLNLINSGRVCALVSAYEQAADKAYNNQDDIESTRLAIEDIHTNLMRVDTENADLIQSAPAVRQAVEAVRLSALSVLDTKEQSAYSLTTVNSRANISSLVMAYNLYAEDMISSDDLTEKTMEIRALNPTMASDKFKNDITVLQAS